MPILSQNSVPKQDDINKINGLVRTGNLVGAKETAEAKARASTTYGQQEEKKAIERARTKKVPVDDAKKKEIDSQLHKQGGFQLAADTIKNALVDATMSKDVLNNSYTPEEKQVITEAVEAIVANCITDDANMEDIAQSCCDKYQDIAFDAGETCNIDFNKIMNAIKQKMGMRADYDSVEINPCVVECAKKVMTAYQNANKWLDSTKEAVYSDMNCPFFSSFIHELAHKMPGLFDDFGDILHSANIKVPYPATEEIHEEPTNIDEVFIVLFGVLDEIEHSLNEFINCTADEYHGMAVDAENCLSDIESEYPMLYRLKGAWGNSHDDMITFDKFVCQYVDHKDDLLEGLGDEKSETPIGNENEGEGGWEPYKGYDIEYNFNGNGEYTVQVDGDDVVFKSKEEAMNFIDSLDGGDYESEDALTPWLQSKM